VFRTDLEIKEELTLKEVRSLEVVSIQKLLISKWIILQSPNEHWTSDGALLKNRGSQRLFLFATLIMRVEVR